jgi:hypothetical protein
MKITGEGLFPLALLLVKNQMRAHLIEIAHLLILDQPDKPAAGFYKHKNRTLCLNIGVLGNYLDKYEIDANNQLAIPRCAAAVIFEECWHAIHSEDTGDIAEAKARKYSIDLLKRLPDELLIAHGGDLYNSCQKTSAIAIAETAEVETPQPKKMPIMSGGMFDFVNEVIELDLPPTKIETKFGSMETARLGEINVFSFTIDQKKLTTVNEAVGNAKKAGFEHGGLIYSWENGNWDVLVDIDDKKMLEVDKSRTFTITALKSGKDMVVEATV